MYDYLIVGAGFSGAVMAERIAGQLDKKVLLIDKRAHIGGNAYDHFNSDGMLVHKYGPHWFHTNDAKVFSYLSQFTEWIYHYHRVKTYVDGLLLPIPINMDTLNLLYGMSLNSPSEVEKYLNSVRLSIESPRNSEEIVLNSIGKDLYEKFFRGYTTKQWGIEPSKLNASVAGRIPTRFNKDSRYFTDKYQGMPKLGYAHIFNNMLKNKNIHIMLNADLRAVEKEIKFNKMIYTGPVDEFFDGMHGKLPYRSLRFEHETLNAEYYQEVQQINYPNEYDFTRIIEWKHATKQKSSKTTITREYPLQADDANEKYYPIPMPENQTLYEKYKVETQKLKNVLFLGRLAEYKYYNMDQVIARALTIFEKEINL